MVGLNMRGVTIGSGYKGVYALLQNVGNYNNSNASFSDSYESYGFMSIYEVAICNILVRLSALT